MADHSGSLAHVEDGRSLLPEIVRKEVELEQKLKEADTESSDLIKQAREQRDAAVQEAQAGFPKQEEQFLKAELKKFDKELEELKASEGERLDALRDSAKKQVDEASKAIAAFVLETQN